MRNLLPFDAWPFLAQLWAILSYTKWLECGSGIAAAGSPQLASCIGQLCRGLLIDFDARSSKKYRGATLPNYHAIAESAKRELLSAVYLIEHSQAVSSQKCWKLQQALLVALQILLPPLRGETYWDLTMTPTKTSSMTVYSPWFLLSPLH